MPTYDIQEAFDRMVRELNDIVQAVNHNIQSVGILDERLKNVERILVGIVDSGRQ